MGDEILQQWQLMCENNFYISRIVVIYNYVGWTYTFLERNASNEHLHTTLCSTLHIFQIKP